MKDYTQAELEESRPQKSAEDCIEHCLGRLYADRTRCLEEEIVHHLTFEEVIGALLRAKDEINTLNEALENEREY